jgi:hypothetical protein
MVMDPPKLKMPEQLESPMLISICSPAEVNQLLVKLILLLTTWLTMESLLNHQLKISPVLKVCQLDI